MACIRKNIVNIRAALGVGGLGVTGSEGASLVRFQWEGIGEETDC